jgi:hypothetical protein
MKTFLEKNEWTVCPTIWVDDKIDHSNDDNFNTAKNIKTGYLVYGINLDHVLFQLNKDDGKNYFNINKNMISLNELYEGYYTNFENFMKCLINTH